MKKDFTIFSDENKFVAWPANFQTAGWEDQMFTSFVKGEHRGNSGLHSFDRDKPWTLCIARSYDNGETWETEDTDLYEANPSYHVKKPELLKQFNGKIDFTDPNFVLMFNMSGHSSENEFSWWYYSTDKGHNWDGPFSITKMPEIPSTLSMRTQYIVLNSDEMLIFGTCQKSNHKEGRSFCAKMFSDGSFEFQGWIGDEIPGGRSIMPQARMRKDGTLVAFMRNKEKYADNERLHYIAQYESKDMGKTWIYQRIPCPICHKGSNPPCLVVLNDGTWVLIYGVRDMPAGIRCVYSEDEGVRWSHEITLRPGNLGADLGYCRAIARPDGSAFVAYYYSWTPELPRSIEGTIFDKEYLLKGKLK